MQKTPYARTPRSEGRESKMRVVAPELLQNAGYREVRSRRVKGMQLVDAVDTHGAPITAWVKCAWAPGSHGTCAVQIDFPPRDRRPKDSRGVVKLVREKAARAEANGATHLFLFAADDNVTQTLAAYLMPIAVVGSATQEAIRISPDRVKNGHSPSLYIVASKPPRSELVKVVRAHSINLLAQLGEARFTQLCAINDLDQVPLGSATPSKLLVSGFAYERDPAVRSFVRERAAGKCEYCGQLGFLMKKRARFLETHHITSLARQGQDTVANVIALCANHHREAHYGANKESLEQEMLNVLRRLNSNPLRRHRQVRASRRAVADKPLRPFSQ